MRKYSILSILPILVMTVAVLAPLPTSAQVACPTGYTCTPIVVNCPTGYTCTPISHSSNASNTASLTNALSGIISAYTANTTVGANSAINCPPEVASCANVSPIRQGDIIIHATSTVPLLSSYANYATLPYTNSTSTRNGCPVELSFENANLISNFLQLNQTQKASVVNSSTLHVKDIAYRADATMGGQKDYGKSPKAKFLFDICLGSGYTSNIPAGVDANRIISLNTPVTKWIVLNNPDYSTTTKTSHN